jgi:hypothetical protein
MSGPSHLEEVPRTYKADSRFLAVLFRAEIGNLNLMRGTYLVESISAN